MNVDIAALMDEAANKENIPPLTDEDKDRLGFNNCNWVSFLNPLLKSSTKRYLKFMEIIGGWCVSQNDYAFTPESIISFFNHCFYSVSLKPTTLRTWFSILKRFFEFTGRGDLELQVPLCLANFKQWDKSHRVKKASVFTKISEASVKLHCITHMYVE